MMNISAANLACPQSQQKKLRQIQTNCPSFSRQHFRLKVLQKVARGQIIGRQLPDLLHFYVAFLKGSFDLRLRLKPWLQFPVQLLS